MSVVAPLKKRGLSLMEVMIALGIVAFALVTMIGVYISSIRLMTRGEEMTKASEIAQTSLEQAKLLGYGNVPEVETTFDGRVPNPQVAGFPPPPYPALDNYDIVFKTDKLEDGLKSVTVKVFYDKRSHVTLQTYLRP